MAGPKLVNSSTAARELGVHYSALSRWVAEGKVTPALRTPGGHLRWDMADLRRQLQANEESAALDPMRAAYANAVAIAAGVEDLHAALTLLGAVVNLLQTQLGEATTQRSELVQRIFEQDALALKPLADKVSMSQARANQRGH